MLGLLVVGLASVLIAGCGSKVNGSKVNQSNYDKIAFGMNVAEVEGVMGKGTEEAVEAGATGNMTGSVKVMSWKDGDKNITVTFVNGKVMSKAQTNL
jgi:hypothetical protein